MVQVYTEPLYRRHFTSLLGWPVLLRIFLLLGAIAVSLVVAYATGGFWVKISPTLSQPLVHYTGDALIVVEVSPLSGCNMQGMLWHRSGSPQKSVMLRYQGATAGQEMVWSTSYTINNEFSTQYMPANVQVSIICT